MPYVQGKRGGNIAQGIVFAYEEGPQDVPVGNAEGFGEGGYVEGKLIPRLRIILPPIALSTCPGIDGSEGLPTA